MRCDRRTFLASGAAGLLVALGAPVAGLANQPITVAEEILRSQLETLSQGQLRTIAREPILIEAVRAQNAVTRTYPLDQIAQLDGEWRREVYANDTRSLIPTVMETPASRYLQRVTELAGGLYTEFILMDARGLNVALSTLTPDYWQGAEDKFIQTYGEGLRGYYMGADEFNPATGIRQRRIAITVVDPRTLMPLGALCAGIDLAKI